MLFLLRITRKTNEKAWNFPRNCGSIWKVLCVRCDQCWDSMELYCPTFFSFVLSQNRSSNEKLINKTHIFPSWLWACNCTLCSWPRPERISERKSQFQFPEEPEISVGTAGKLALNLARTLWKQISRLTQSYPRAFGRSFERAAGLGTIGRSRRPRGLRMKSSALRYVASEARRAREEKEACT